MEQLKEFCLLYMMRLSDVFLRLREPDIENAGSSIKDLICFVNIYFDRSFRYMIIFNFLISIPIKDKSLNGT